MKKNHITRDSIIVGLALFSTMFGAGNLIFPPQIGLADGTQWGWGALGIVLTGVILPVLAFWGVNNVGTDVKCLMGHVHPKFYDVFYLIGCILVGMGSTLPRNGATTHEMGVLSIFPNAPSWLTMIIFFALVFFFGCDKGKVVDKLGKYLTPLLLILLAIVLVKGVISPIGTPQDTGVSKPLPSAMLTGYLTGDLTVGLMCANIFIGGILDKGHTNPLERKRSGLIVGLTSTMLSNTIVPHLSDIGYAATYASGVMSCYMGLLAVCKILLGGMYDRLGMRKSTFISVSAILVGLLGLYFGAFQPMHLFIVAGAALGCAVGTVAYPILTQSAFGTRAYATIYGIITAANSLASSVCPIFTNSVYDGTGSYSPALVTSIVLALAVLGLLFTIRPLRPEEMDRKPDLEKMA